MSTLRVNRIEPRTGGSLEIVGFGGGVSNIHMSSKTGQSTYPQGVWSRYVMDFNWTAAINTNYDGATGVYTVGTGEGGIYFTNFNCNLYGNSQLWDANSSVYVNGEGVIYGLGQGTQGGYVDGLSVPSTGLLFLSDGDEVSCYVNGRSTGATTQDIKVKDDMNSGKAIATWTMFKIGGSS
jgi:hypothetical protein